MKRILFVDDEPNVLDGLRRMLRSMRREWDMNFAGGGEEALALLKDHPIDVVVSDMRMPGMDGAQLLTEVARRYPRTVRIVLSGHSDKELVLRSVGPAHQYLSKPCEAQRIKDVIARACTLRDLLDDEALTKLVSRLKTVPSLPQAYTRIVEELQSRNASLKRVGEIIARDVGMTAKVLQLVNSAFFGVPHQVSSPAQAATYLGLETLKALVLSVHVFSRLDQTRVRGLSLDKLWSHSVATGTLAKRIAEAERASEGTRDHALLAGLLHDAGRLVLAANLPDKYGATLESMRRGGGSVCQAERGVFGTTHAIVGAYLLGLWGLPDPIVEAVAYHHDPGECSAAGFAPLTAVHVANVLDSQTHAGGDAPGAPRLDEEYLQRVGVWERVPAWRQIAESTMAQGAGA